MKESYTLEEIYSYLKGFHLSESLYTIGAINSALKFGGDSYFTDSIPQYIIYWLNRFGNKRVNNLEILLYTSRMARFLILSGASDNSSKMMILGTQEFNMAFNMIGRLAEPDFKKQLKNEKTVNSFFGRLSAWQFPLQSDRLIPLGRAYLLFVEIPEKLNQEYDYDLKMKEFFNIGALEYLYCGYALWQTTNGTLDYRLKPGFNPLNSIITNQHLDTMVKLITGSPMQYRQAIRRDNWEKIDHYKDLNALDPFLAMPAISVQNSTKLRSDSFVVPQPKYLLDKISTGIFYLLADRELQNAREEGSESKKNSFRNSFGGVYRESVKIQLEQAKSSDILIDLDNDFENSNKRKIPDFALLRDGTCVLFEVKTSILKVAARTYFEEEQLKKEIEEGSLKKALNQLNTFKQEILNKTIPDKRFHNINTIICVLVCYEDIFVLNATLLPLIQEKYPELSENLQLACISDIDAIGYGLSKEINIGQLLLEKTTNNFLNSHMIATVIESKIGRGNHLLQASFKKFFQNMGVEI